MRRFAIPLALLALTATGLSLASAAFAHECETSCSARCVTIVDEFERVAQANRDYCGGSVPQCVVNCNARYSDGTCREYGADYCGRDPKCVEQCSARYSDGSCREYTRDFCGEGRISCATQCAARYSDGSCREYGADVCGRNAYCQQNCISRWSDGSCREYGADNCGTR